MRNKKSFILIIISLISSLFFTGCWDKVEIDRRVFVSTIGVDIAKDIDKGKKVKDKKPEEIIPNEELKKIKVGYSFPDLSEFSTQKGIISGDQSLEVNTYSMDGAITQASMKSGRYIYLDHTRLLILSRDLLGYEETVKEVMDYIQRQPKINRKMYMIMSDGPPNEFVKGKIPIDKHIQVYINGVLDNAEKSAAAIPVTLNEFLIMASSRNIGMLPIMSLNGDTNEVVLSGTAVLKNNKLKGRLNEVETTSLELLRGQAKGIKSVLYYNGHPIDYEINGILKRTKVSYDEKLHVNLELEIEGKANSGYLGEERTLSGDKVTAIEELFDKKIGSECEQLCQLMRGNLNVDLLEISNHIEKFNPSIWNEIKDNWDEAFKESDIKVSVKSHIRQLGVIK
ncbi:Ger(x)C family spore germination protein [Clostridium frigidicarnis]|uniref:Spore germination protein n=1 Tax=Clostridium frigidicarnis TaxID=84698 RepID=A0A1I0ZGG1_9CLOT|nr:Ger(x)C family spore germination protein [Clostridium frigidicarnis]SFB24216.1 spore germination protein [Clostridium frigidicarnis]